MCLVEDKGLRLRQHGYWLVLTPFAAVDGIAVKNGPHLQMLVNARLGGDFVSVSVKRGDEELRFGPFALLDAPWSEQKGSKDQEQAPSFPPLRKPEGR